MKINANVNGKNIHPVTIVQGAQWGSEAKGAVTGFLSITDPKPDYVVRTGTVNAGHTVYYKGKPYVFQQLPVGWVNPDAQLILGPGAYIHPNILLQEIDRINSAMGAGFGSSSDVRKRLWIDHRCGLHLPEHTELATAAGRHYSMGATGKGCSEAVMSKIRNRGNGGELFINWLFREGGSRYWLSRDGGSGFGNLQFTDTAKLLNHKWDGGAKILIEGTQGTLLDLHLGLYPYTTHKQTQCGNWMAECGLSPALPVDVVLVARTYPIRVAGNSGPMPGEISWTRLARDINIKLAASGLPPRVQEESLQAFEDACSDVARRHHMAGYDIEDWSVIARTASPKFVSELHQESFNMLHPATIADLRNLFELTTVTKKLRRIAKLDVSALRESCQLNRPAYVVLTFINYEYPQLWGATSGEISNMRDTGAVVAMWGHVHNLQQQIGYPIRYVTTGPGPEHVIESPYYRLGKFPVRTGRQENELETRKFPQ